MSNIFDSSNSNPYSSSFTTPPQQPAKVDAKLPGYCTAMFIISLVFSILRIITTGFSILGVILLSQSNEPSPLGSSAIWEVITGAGMMLSGIIGNSLMLARKPAGLVFGYALVFFVLTSFIVAGFQIVTMINTPIPGAGPNAQAQMVGMMIGGGVSIIFRLGLLGAYVVALMKFKNWVEANR